MPNQTFIEISALYHDKEEICSKFNYIFCYNILQLISQHMHQLTITDFYWNRSLSFRQIRTFELGMTQLCIKQWKKQYSLFTDMKISQKICTMQKYMYLSLSFQFLNSTKRLRKVGIVLSHES